MEAELIVDNTRTEDAYRDGVDTVAAPPEDIPFLVHTRSLHSDGGFDRSLDYTDLSIPLTGPLRLSGVNPGDRLRIDIHAVNIGHRGAMVTLPGRGGFARELPSSGRSLEIADGMVCFDQDIHLPARPMIGKIGVAVPGRIGEAPDSSTAGGHGGNIDCKEIASGSSVFLTALASDALLYLGDLHAIQADGEACLTGVEVEGSVRLSWHGVREPRPDGVERPVVRTADARLMTIGDGDSLDEAVTCALDDMLELVIAARGWSRPKAAMFISAAADAGICQVVNPRRTAKVSINLCYLTGLPWLPDARSSN